MKGRVTQTSPLRVRLAGSVADMPALASVSLAPAEGDEVHCVMHGSELLVVAVVSR